MTCYISLLNFTEQGVKTAKETVNRARTFEKALEAMGIRKIGVWWTIGQYDLVLIAEGPDDQTMARAMLQLGMAGNVSAPCRGQRAHPLHARLQRRRDAGHCLRHQITSKDHLRL
jgi:uncharacterized protein with GYD domain